MRETGSGWQDCRVEHDDAVFAVRRPLARETVLPVLGRLPSSRCAHSSSSSDDLGCDVGDVDASTEVGVRREGYDGRSERMHPDVGGAHRVRHDDPHFYAAPDFAAPPRAPPRRLLRHRRRHGVVARQSARTSRSGDLPKHPTRPRPPSQQRRRDRRPARVRRVAENFTSQPSARLT